MEPFDTAIAKSITRQELLSLSSSSSSSLVLSPLRIDDFIENLSPKPVAAASIGQVYFGFLNRTSAITNNSHHDDNDTTNTNTRMKVAIKVKRPGIRDTVLRDAAFLKLGARLIDQLSFPFGGSGSSGAVIATRLENAVDEFMTRIFEELDYRREATNVQTFARLYSHRRHENGNRHDITTSSSSSTSTSSKIQVVVPELVPGLCTQEILVMEWLNGTKFDAVPVLPNILLNDDNNNNALLLTVTERKQLEQRKREIAEAIEQDLKLVQTGIQCTLSQLIETGIVHADPHTGNLLKVLMPAKTQRRGRAATTAVAFDNDVMLGYLDFGLLATIPETVRDALVCSVAQLVFARNIDAMARLFIDLQLLPPHRAILFDSDPVERTVFTQALNETLDKVLQFPDKDSSSSSPSSSVVPILRFDNLLGGLTALVARFEFQLPPYFLNNARALATLEGVARRLDPKFNVLQIMYPFALNRLLNNPSQSPIVDDTLMSLLRSPDTDIIEMPRIQKLLDDSALLTGYSRRRVLQDVVASKGGRRTIRKVLREMLLSSFITTKRRRGKNRGTFLAKRIIFRL